MPAPARSSTGTLPTPSPADIPRERPASGGDLQLERSELLGLGRRGKPWDFLEIACRTVAENPDDHELIFLLAANFARLHLKTAATEALELLPARSRAEAGVTALADLIGGLTSDELTLAERTEAVIANLESIALHGIDLSEAFVQWSSRPQDFEYFKASDGNVIRRSRPLAGNRSVWTWLADLRGDARAYTLRSLATPDSRRRPHTLLGIDPPWLLQELAAALTRNDDGHIARINLVEVDPIKALEGLSVSDVSTALYSPRVHVYIGPGALQQLGSDLRGRLHTGVTGPIVQNPAANAQPLLRPVEALFATLEREQSAAQSELAAEARKLYEPRSPGWWHQRFEEARAGGPKLRVLVPTCRFSTFVKHSSSDIVAAFEKAGCEARLLIEPDETCQLNAVAYLREIVRFQPDLIVMINYTRLTLRGMFGPYIPTQLPFVCWIQDAMPHLFRESAGSQHGALDFLIGHQHKELFDRFAYPKQRTMACTVAASESKFHALPVDPALARKHRCEIAYASRHAETVEALHGRLCREASHDPSLVRVLEHLYPLVRAVGENPMVQFAHVTFDRLTAEALVAVGHRGPQPDPKLQALLAKQYCAPIAERAVRHQTLRWAADIADAKGWKLNIYGRGWDSHPRFAPYARGELNHGEELRASYQAATVHLHSTVHFLMHQRVAECLLSGGFPMIRLNMEEVSTLYWAALSALFARGTPPDRTDPASGRPAFEVANHPELCRLTALRQRLGLPVEALIPYHPARREHFVTSRATVRPEEQSLWLLADSAESFFHSPDTLEENIRLALERPTLRRVTSAHAASRVANHLTYSAIATRCLSLVRRSLAESACSSNGKGRAA